MFAIAQRELTHRKARPRLLTACATAAVFCCLLLPRAQAASASQADYTPAIQALERFIREQMADKELPALSIALVDDQRTVWATGFGFAAPESQTPATQRTVYRVGSVSKLFTDIAVMQLVEQGKLDLDAPVSRYLPDFRPRNPFDAPVTLRQLMAHRSGLVREPPLGSYFDPTEPTLARTIASLNETELVYAPGARTKYSNAGISVVGEVVARVQGEPFVQALKLAVLDPLGMTHSSFAPTPAGREHLAKGYMWTVDGRVFEAPTFELGIAPAGSLYSTVGDLGLFISALFAGGRGVHGRLLQQTTLDQMWTPQFAESGKKAGYGLGFALSEVDGRRSVGHDGAIYGFATSLRALPDEKLGVVAVTTKDVANAVTDRIADYALRTMLAARHKRPIPAPEVTAPIAAQLMKKLAGRYSNGEKTVELKESAGRLFMCCTEAGAQVRLRSSGDALIVDDRLEYGARIALRGNAIVINDETLERVDAPEPPPAPAALRGLIGEYGWDHEILYIFEKGGELWTLIEWVEFNRLKRVAQNVYAFADRGLYAGERLIFTRAADGRATQVEAAGIVFKRRNVGPEAGVAQLRIQPVRPVKELLPQARAARPPQESGEFREPDLIEPTALDPTIMLDIRYATTNNFLSSVFYAEPRAFLQRPAAQALVRAHRALGKSGYGLLIHDAYRPWFVTKVFWDATPEDLKKFVADPSQGSRHNRGAAVDLTLYDLKTSEAVEMVGTYDETSDRSYPDYPGGTSLQRWRRELLRDAMEAEGFTVYPVEWWHYDYADWRKYPIGNLPFDRLQR